jgi:hypothetical protein
MKVRPGLGQQVALGHEAEVQRIDRLLGAEAVAA